MSKLYTAIFLLFKSPQPETQEQPCVKYGSYLPVPALITFVVCVG